MIKWFSLLLILPLMMCGCVSMQYTHGVPNFRQVDANVYRGGQPTQQGWDYLIHKIGIRIDIKLNEGSDDYALSNGVAVADTPINFIQQTIGEPDFLKLDEDLVILNYCKIHNIKVYFHCSHGQDRTGTLAWFYRTDIDNWPKDKATKELMADGFHPWLRGLGWAMEDYEH